MSAAPLVTLESPLPPDLPEGTAAAVFCYGTCLHAAGAVERVDLVADGGRPRRAIDGMPRPDVAGAGGSRSGFWGTVPLRAGSAGDPVEIAAHVRMAGGVVHELPLGRIDVVAAAPPVLDPVEPDVVAVCMATFDPDPTLFAAQIESLRAQTDQRWICVISDDCSDAARYAALEAAVAGDPRFVVARAERRLGFYRNFERAMAMAPPGAELLALCDQDDRWHPEKLSVLRAALGTAGLVYSDQRLVDADGRLLRGTMWRGRRNNHTDLASLLVANSVTGAATLFRREIARLALPFPDTPGLQFHDHWLGLVALAAGEVAYVDRPLYDYVQHAGAVFGEVSQQRPAASRRGLLRGGRGAYFLGYLPRVVQAEVLLARCEHRLTPAKRRALGWFVAADRSSLALAWLALRSLRVLSGRSETLGSEAELARGVLWRRTTAVLARAAARAGRRAGDARIPDVLSFEQRRLRRWRARL